MTRSSGISSALARRIALAAQGFADPHPGGPVDVRHLRRVMGRVGFLQLDALNVLCRMHYLTVYARLGPYPRTLLDRLAWGGARREWFEYWGNAATLLPLSSHPLLRWRMERAGTEPRSGARSAARLPAGYVDEVLAIVAERGPLSAGEVAPSSPSPRGGGMFNWSPAKVALEWLFFTGRLSVAARPHFTRMYDLTERVLPPEVVAAPTPVAAELATELRQLAGWLDLDSVVVADRGNLARPLARSGL